jgi:feruloyl esterase
MVKDVQYPQGLELHVTEYFFILKMKVEHSLSCLSLSSASAVFANPPTCPDSSSNLTSTCAALAASLNIENATVQLSEFVAAGTNLTLPTYDQTCAQEPLAITTGFCRVALSVSTSSRSGFRMEAWLPSNWTGRFLSVGNGGLNGCISYSDLAYTAAQGFASVGTNNGHDGTSGEPFLNNSDVVEDFAYRA